MRRILWFWCWVGMIAGASAPFSSAETLQLKLPSSPASTLPGYDHSFNRAPPFRVWQNDPALSDLYVRPGVTDLCVPSTTLNVLLYQAYRRVPQITGLSIPGVTPEGSVDSAELIRWFLRECSLPATRSNLGDAMGCVQRIYREQLGFTPKATYIRPNQGGFGPDLNYQDRKPTLQDFRSALDAHQEVILVLGFERYDANTRNWITASRHAVNVWGYSYREAEPDRLVLYIQNSNRVYENMDFKTPVFDTIQLDARPGGEIRVSTLAGELINFPGRNTQVVALMSVSAAR